MTSDLQGQAQIESGGKPEPTRAEELDRVMGPFASLALSMSAICILAGPITSFHVGFCSVGGASIGIGWPLYCLFALTVALTMGQVASAFPRAGGPYQWTAILGGKGWGWAAACFNLAGLVTVLAALNVGTCRFVICALSRKLEYHPENVQPAVQALAVLLMTASQALINHRGIRLTMRLIDLSGWLIMVVALVLTGVLFLFGVLLGVGFEPVRLVTFSNYSGLPPGELQVWPSTQNIAWLFALGLLLPAYTLTGFDAAAQTAEETRNPRVNVPRGIVRGVLISGLAGWVMLSAMVLAIPDMAEAAGKGEQCFFYLIRTVVPYDLHFPLYAGLVAAMYLCGLATLTSASRLTYGFARDGGLPFSAALRRIGTHRSPSVAIWTIGCAAVFFAVCISYEAIAAVCAIFLDIAYVLPAIMGLLTYRRWAHLAEWNIGGWYRPLAVVCVLGCLAVIVIGMQPPNQIAVWVVSLMIVGLVGVWFGYVRRQPHYQGPPPEVLAQMHPVSARTPDPDDSRIGCQASPQDDIKCLFPLIPVLKQRAVTVQQLGGGLTNRNYRLDAEGDLYVLRIAGADTDLLGINRNREIAAARVAADAGIGPEVIAFLPEHRALVTRFVQGRQLTAADMHQPPTIQRVAQSLRTVHNFPVPPGLDRFCPFAAVRNNCELTVARSGSLPGDLNRAMQLLPLIEKELQTGEPFCLCHNDLLPANFIDDGVIPRIIDWEYAGLGDRFFDLGNFAANNQLVEDEEQFLLASYFGEPRNDHIRRLRLMRLASDLREATWGYLQACISQLYTPAYYLDYGRKYLDRFLAAEAVANRP